MRTCLLGVLVAAGTLGLGGCVSTAGPPTMPLTAGAEVVEIRDSKTIKDKPLDLTGCRALGRVEAGPIGFNNLDVALKNETHALAHLRCGDLVGL